MVNSCLVFRGSYVYDSEKVIASKNINQSNNILYSCYVVESQDIYKSNNCTECGQLIRCDDMEQSYFCVDCAGLKNSLFCRGITDG